VCILTSDFFSSPLSASSFELSSFLLSCSLAFLLSALLLLLLLLLLPELSPDSTRQTDQPGGENPKFSLVSRKPLNQPIYLLLPAFLPVGCGHSSE